MPAFNPGPWNDPTAIVLNNCYNYALDRLDNVRRDPGALSGNTLFPPFLSVGCVVGMMACQDGLLAAPLLPGLHFQTPDRWPVALVTAQPQPGMPFGDYHWYRRDDTGLWSHKAGFGSEATDLDEDGNPIYEPFTCARGEYRYFIGYFVVHRNAIGRKP
jgi:hypothetical protein